MEVVSLGERLVRINLVGRLDTQGVDRVETKFVSSVVPAGNNAVVDLSGVDFLGSMGIRMLISTARSLKARQARLVLFGVPQQVGQVFEAVALHRVINICGKEAEALAVVSTPQD
jgi:anti-anti-sigma factor